MGLRLLMHHHQITGQDAGIQHGLTPHPQGKILPLPSVGVEGQVVLDALLSQDGCAGGHRAHDGDAAHGHLRLRRGRVGRRRSRCGGRCALQRRQRQGAALAGPLGQDAHLLHMLQMKVYRGR